MSTKLSKEDHLNILEDAIEAFTINDIEISRAAMEILGNYFQFSYIKDPEIE
jgi:hypothetical protein